MLEIYLIRHAESESNANPRYVCGRSDEVLLTSKGERQAQLLAGRLKEIPFNLIYASPAFRAQETARIATQGGYDIVTDGRLHELDQGDFQGKLRTQIYTPELLDQIRNQGSNFRPPNGESRNDVEKRMYGWLQEIPLREGIVGVFSHHVAIKCLLRKIFDAEERYVLDTHLENSSISKITKSQEFGLGVDFVNDRCHLNSK